MESLEEELINRKIRFQEIEGDLLRVQVGRGLIRVQVGRGLLKVQVGRGLLRV